MFKPHTVLGFGLWLIAVKFLGISDDWKIKLYLATGMILVLMYLLRLARETLVRLAQERTTPADTFTENGHMADSGRPHKDLPRP